MWRFVTLLFGTLISHIHEVFSRCIMCSFPDCCFASNLSKKSGIFTLQGKIGPNCLNWKGSSMLPLIMLLLIPKILLFHYSCPKLKFLRFWLLILYFFIWALRYMLFWAFIVQHLESVKISLHCTNFYTVNQFLYWLQF